MSHQALKSSGRPAVASGVLCEKDMDMLLKKSKPPSLGVKVVGMDMLVLME